MTVELNEHRDFQPGVTLRHWDGKHLERLGFEPGYPLYALRHFDPLWAIHAISDPEGYGHLPRQPKLIVTGFHAGEHPITEDVRDRNCRLPMLVHTVQFTWGSGEMFIEGKLEKETPDLAWTLDGKKVYDHVVRIVITSNPRRGFIQVIPIGFRNKALPPTSEGFVWASSIPEEIRRR